MSVDDPIRELTHDAPFTRLQALVDALPALVSYVDRRQRCRFANRAHAEWLGRERAALQGAPLRELFGEGGYVLVRPHAERALAGETMQFQMRVEQPGGGARDLELRCVPDVAEGAVLGFFAFAEDVTDRRHAEGAIDPSRSQEEFFGRLAHELRNPLAPIRNALEVLQLAEADRAMTASARAIIERQLRHLVRLIDDLIDV
jgi:PAS domain S-box-containing protein